MRTLPIAAILLVSSAAHADSRITTLAPTCADVAPDGLDEATRERTEQVLARTLEQANVFVVESDCAETYQVSYRNNMIVLAGPRTTIREVRSPNVGDQLAELIERERAYREPEAAPPAAEESTAQQRLDVATVEAEVMGVENPNATEEEESEPSDAPPPPVKNLLYAQLGFGGTAGFEGGHALALGLRQTLSKVDLDISVGSITNTTYAKAELLSTPAANRSKPYVGGGLSIGSVETSSNQSTSGVAAEFTAGVMMSSSHRWFMQGDASLPFFTANGEFPMTIAISLGYAFAKQ